MTLSETHRILVGTRGWIHPHWDGQFYPDDLPPDWQLAYYGNEFPVVLARQQEWQSGVISDWLEETDDSPGFICELELAQLSDKENRLEEKFFQVLKELGERCLGTVIRVNSPKPLTDIESLLVKCKALAPVCVDVDGPHSSALQSMLDLHGINPLWKNAQPAEKVNGPLIIASLDSPATGLQEIRGMLEQLFKYDDEQHTLVLMLGGNQPNLEIIRQTRVMIDLM